LALAHIPLVHGLLLLLLLLLLLFWLLLFWLLLFWLLLLLLLFWLLLLLLLLLLPIWVLASACRCWFSWFRRVLYLVRFAHRLLVLPLHIVRSVRGVGTMPLPLLRAFGCAALLHKFTRQPADERPQSCYLRVQET
jgi:hypothetical protein